MIKSVSFCGVTSVKGLSPRREIALISILDDEERYERPALYGFAKVLCQSHVDFYEEQEGMPIGSVDDDSGLIGGMEAPVPGESVFCMKDAHEILSFVEDSLADPRPLELIIHCHAGISRSAAVAKFVCEKYGLELNTNRDLCGANPRVGRILNKAFTQRMAIKASAQSLEGSRRMIPLAGSKSKPNFP